MVRCAGTQRSARHGSTTRRRAGDWSTMSQHCCFASVCSRGSSEFARPDTATGWHLYIYGAENQARFLRHVGVHGVKATAAREVLTHLESVVRNTNLDTVPREVWSQVKTSLVSREMTHREFAAAMGTKFCGSTMWKHAPSRSRLHRAAALLEDHEIHDLATSDVFWDQIVEITSLGEMDVYDGTVDGTHNFVANGISVHNSSRTRCGHGHPAEPAGRLRARRPARR